MLSAALATIQLEAHLDPLTAAYAVMGIKYVRKLNYKKLLKYPRYNNEWNLSSSKKFDHLDQGKK